MHTMQLLIFCVCLFVLLIGFYFFSLLEQGEKSHAYAFSSNVKVLFFPPKPRSDGFGRPPPLRLFIAEAFGGAALLHSDRAGRRRGAADFFGFFVMVLLLLFFFHLRMHCCSDFFA